MHCYYLRSFQINSYHTLSALTPAFSQYVFYILRIVFHLKYLSFPVVWLYWFLLPGSSLPLHLFNRALSSKHSSNTSPAMLSSCCPGKQFWVSVIVSTCLLHFLHYTLKRDLCFVSYLSYRTSELITALHALKSPPPSHPQDLSIEQLIPIHFFILFFTNRN